MKSSVRAMRVAAGALTAMLGGGAAYAADNISADIGVSENSHFVSYGVDVWKGNSHFFGDKSTTWVWGDFALKTTDWLTFNLTVWSDNNGNVRSGIGGHIQEIDVDPGFTITLGKFAGGVTYNAWSYAGDVEESVDFSLSYDDTGLIIPDFAFHPKAVWHYRASGNGAQKVGSAVVLSIAPGFDIMQDLNLAIPAGIALFTTDTFQGGWEGGYGFSYLGGSLTYTIGQIPKEYGKWALNFGVTAYFTKHEAIPGNAAADFITGTVGVTVAY